MTVKGMVSMRIKTDLYESQPLDAYTGGRLSVGHA